jgi:dTDP-4-dehydrorhamnose reductase
VGNYATDDERDAEDVYGFSKALGEVVAETGKCQIIRASIIGPQLKGGAGLMGWFQSQRTSVKGFTNHHWNGITTLEWAKLASEIMRGELTPARPILQVSSAAPLSKFELLQAISETWAHHINIEPVAAPQRIDRTLAGDLVRSSILSQLREQYAWYRNVEPTN